MARAKPSTRVWAFLRAFGGRWFVYMSGAPSVPFTLAALYVENTWAKTLFAVLAVLSAALACYWVWRREREQAISLAERVDQLEERLKPTLRFVLRDCCVESAIARGSIGVGNPSPTSVEEANVYITIPAIRMEDRVLKWSGMGPREGLVIHPATLPRHHHTQPFVTVGGRSCTVHTGYEEREIPPGRYIAELCVKGRDVTAATAYVEFICALPQSLTMRLLTEAEAKKAGASQ